MRATLSILAALCCLVLAAPAKAWNPEGHAIVALVAEHYLDPAVKQRVAAMLAADPDPLTGHGIAEAASWADRFRDSDKGTTQVHYLATREWHWIDLDIDHPDLDQACFHLHGKPAAGPASAGPAQDCIVDKIETFMAELGAKDTAPEERVLALKYVLHFVGDLHQPLHASERQGDHGGATVQIVADGAPDTLHRYWNQALFDYLGDDAKAVADDLADGVRQSGTLAKMQAGAPADWAWESFGLARDQAYGKLPTPRADGAYVLPPDYTTNAIETVRLQLARAGVRLAAVLNRALAP